MKQKIISGSYNYVNHAAKQHCFLGWRVITKKKWSDGKWTYVLTYEG